MDLSDARALSNAVHKHLELLANYDDPELTYLYGSSPLSAPPSSRSSSSDDAVEGASDDAGGQYEAVTRRRSSVTVPSRFYEPQVVQFEPSVGAEASRKTFSREAVPCALAEGATSALAKLLRSKETDDVGAGSGSVEIRVFGSPVPGEPLLLRVHRGATIGQAISLSLQRYMKATGGEGLSADSFEMLMAEEDGQPDEDMPKLSRNQLILDFGHFDFALRQTGPIHLAREPLGDSAAADTLASSRGLLRVHLPPGKQDGEQLKERSVMFKASPTMFLRELMQQVCAKPNVYLDPDKHVFVLLPQASGNEELDLDTTAVEKLFKLPAFDAAEPKLYIRQRRYEDAPRKKRCATLRAPSEAHARDEKKDTDFIFSETTASRYKEYNVVKVNKRGVKQERVLGIDQQRLYNIARPDTEADSGLADGLREWGLKTIGLRYSGGTKHPSHLIRDIHNVCMDHDDPGAPGRAFTCTIRDPFELGYSKVYRYEASTNHDAAEIVAKLQHLIKLHKSQKVPSSRHEGGSAGAGLLDERPHPLHKHREQSETSRYLMRAAPVLARRRSSASNYLTGMGHQHL